MFSFTLSDFWYNWNIIHGLILLFLTSFVLALFLQISFFSLLVRSLQLLIAVGLLFLLIVQFKNIITLPGFYQDINLWNKKYMSSETLTELGQNFFNSNIFFESLSTNNSSTTLWFNIDYDPLYHFSILILLSFIIFLFIGLSDYMLIKENYRIEYPLMFFLVFISGIALFLSNDIISVLISLECITFSGYILVGFDKLRRLSASSGIRYLILGSIPSAFLIIGLTFLYGNFGILAKDALEIISSSFIENILFITNKFENLENSLKLYSTTNEEIILGSYSKEYGLQSDKKFLIDFTWLNIEAIFSEFLNNVSNNTILNFNFYYPESNLLIEQTDDFKWNLTHEKLLNSVYNSLDSLALPTHLMTNYDSGLTQADYSNNKLLALESYEIINGNFFTYSFFDVNLLGLNNINGSDIFNTQTNLATISNEIASSLDSTSLTKALLLLQVSSVLILINLLFKVTGAPFHVWAPSIYTNASTMSVIFLSIFVKLIIFSFFILFFVPVFYSIKNLWGFFLFLVGVLSIFTGLLGAFNETILKKFLIYSSVGHVGFITLGLPFIFIEGNQSTLNYLYVYSITSIILWLIVSSNVNEIKFLTNLKTILLRNGVLSIIFTFVVFSMSGIPPLAGFFVKFDVLLNLMKSTNLFFVGFILLLTVITFFYYLRMIKIVFFETIYWENVKKELTWSNGRFLIVCLLINVVIFYSLIIEQSFSHYFYELLLFSL